MEKLAALRGTPDVRELPFGIVKASPEALGWMRGIRGEVAMARQLERLGAEWTVLHSVPVGGGGSDLDHLVVGPTGVYPINTRRFIGKSVRAAGSGFLVDGRPCDDLRSSDVEAQRVDRVLGAFGIATTVTPIIAISGAKALTVEEPTWNGRRIGVVSIERVVHGIRKRPATLVALEVTRIAQLLGDPAAWRRTSPDPAPSDLLAHVRFIDRGVDRWNVLVRLGAIAVLGIVVGAVIVIGRALTA